ncbi:MAG: sirohydrochlorin cobaltochelatase, partial [Rhodoferax sp.]
PLWHKPIEAVAAHIQGLAPSALVRCAYLELSTPDLPSTAAELVALGVSSITVVPMFLGVGRHAREDLPLLMTALQASHPQMVFKLRPAIGEESRLVALMAQIALTDDL